MTFNSADETQSIELRWRLEDESGVSGNPTADENPRVLLARSDGGSGGTKSWRIDDYDEIRASGTSTDGIYEMTIDLNAADHPVGSYSLSLKEIKDILGNIAFINNEDGYQINIQNSAASSTNTSIPCEQYVQGAKSIEFRYCWEESQSTSGTDYSANVNEPIQVVFSDEEIEIPDSNYAEQLYVEYGIILSNDGNADWDNDKAYAIHQMMERIPQYKRTENQDNRELSKWTLSDSVITDDIDIDDSNPDAKTVNIYSAAFDNANPRIAEIEGKRGLYFSNRLHHAVVRFVTDNGSNKSAVNKILTERYGISIDIDDYLELTGENASRFQDFQDSELISIINMFEELPSGYHKVEGLNYLVRRLNGTISPAYPDAPAIAWVGAGYIEFMESGFNSFSIDYIHRLILHEKAHFLWGSTHNESGDGGVFDNTLKTDWIELGGWYECSSNPSGWCTTKQTEFVSAYAHSKNPNEDIAESLSFFVVNPDALRSRSLAKYEFIRDRIMQGNIYISVIDEELTFEVYNLYPDYVFPGKINRLQVSVIGEPNEDKQVTVEVQLHALDEVLEGANWVRMRIFSGEIIDGSAPYFDLYLNPTNGENVGINLAGTYTLSKYAKSGRWQAWNITIADEVGNLRNEKNNDFGWRMDVKNPLEDLDPPSYDSNTASLSLTSKNYEGMATDVIEASWTYTEAHPEENQGCYGALNDENPNTYSFQKYSPQTYQGDYQPNNCLIEYVMPYYMPSGKYRLNFIRIKDEALNWSNIYFRTPDGVDPGQFTGTPIDEDAAEITIQTTDPDTTPPQIDLNNLSVTATPTNPDAPNGETIVNFTFRVKDDISGYKLGYFTLRDPQGLTTGFYHYPPRRGDVYPGPEDFVYTEYTATVVLPPGSAPGTWGIIEHTVRDRALNFKTYNFTEIISFDVDE